MIRIMPISHTNQRKSFTGVVTGGPAGGGGGGGGAAAASRTGITASKSASCLLIRSSSFSNGNGNAQLLDLSCTTRVRDNDDSNGAWPTGAAAAPAPALTKLRNQRKRPYSDIIRVVGGGGGCLSDDGYGAAGHRRRDGGGGASMQIRQNQIIQPLMEHRADNRRILRGSSSSSTTNLVGAAVAGGFNIKLGQRRWSMEPSSTKTGPQAARQQPSSRLLRDIRPLPSSPRSKVHKSAYNDCAGSGGAARLTIATSSSSSSSADAAAVSSSDNDFSPPTLSHSHSTPAFESHDAHEEAEADDADDWRNTSLDSGLGCSQQSVEEGQRRRREKLSRQRACGLYQKDASLFPDAIFRARKARIGNAAGKKEDNLSTLPDEMLLKILAWLPKVTLGRVAQVNKRLNRLVSDETLWERIDCLGSILAPEHVDIIWRKKPAYLRLARASIPDCVTLLSTPPPLPPPLAAQLLFLDLSMAIISPTMLNKLLGACTNLEKLSLEHLELDSETLEVALVFAHSLDTLNLTMCYNVDGMKLGKFLTESQRLKALNLGCIKHNWTGEDFIKVMSSLPTGLEQLNLSGFRDQLKDTHAQLMASRCTALIDLDLTDCQSLTMISIEAISVIEPIQHIALSRCYAIEAAGYQILATKKSLRFLELFSLFKDASIEALKKLLPGVSINQFPFSAIARPTVGLKRSSIWEQRVRD